MRDIFEVLTITKRMDIVNSDIYQILESIKKLPATSITVTHKIDDC